MNDGLYMKRCLESASAGEGYTVPNPMVGAVLVYDGKIIGEGNHREYGALHAEANAINQVVDKLLLKACTLYVNLEPCCHFGKQTPCTERIIEAGIPRVVIGTSDPFPSVNGKGISLLRNAGIEVITGVSEEESRELNRFFFAYHEKNRPYIFFKWAQTSDGYIDIIRDSSSPPAEISGRAEHIMAHKWRATCQAVLAGTNTVIADNPRLTAREWHGKNPLRVTIDRNGRLNSRYAVFDDSASSLIFVSEKNSKKANYGKNAEIVVLRDEDNVEESIIGELYSRQIQSLMIEGGTMLIESFVKKNLWDEARVFVSEKTFGSGIPAPVINKKARTCEKTPEGILLTYRN